MNNPEKHTFNPSKKKRSGRKAALAAGGLAAAVGASVLIPQLTEHTETERLTAFDENMERIHAAYEDLQVSDIYETQIVSVELGERIFSRTPGDPKNEARNERGMVPSATIEITYHDGDSANEFAVPLPTGDNESSELFWGSHELRIENYFYDDEGQKSEVAVPTFLVESDASDWNPSEIGVQPGKHTTTITMPFDSLGTREVQFYEQLEVFVESSNEDDRRPPRVISEPLGTMTVSVTQDGVEIVEPFSPSEE